MVDDDEVVDVRGDEVEADVIVDIDCCDMTGVLQRGDGGATGRGRSPSGDGWALEWSVMVCGSCG